MKSDLRTNLSEKLKPRWVLFYGLRFLLEGGPYRYGLLSRRAWAKRYCPLGPAFL